MNQLVSIIIPTYNRAYLLGETLDSVSQQTYHNWECIIVDDGSTDNTDEVVGEYVKKDSRFKYYHRPKEHLPGGNGARNYGFKISRGEYIQWFDSDDLMLPDKITKQVKSIYENDSLFSICLYIRKNKDLSQIQIHKSNFDIKYDLYQDYLINSGSVSLNLLSIIFKKNQYQ
jgi:glycosyltransferase involved in cell wall biosynthesis